MFGKFGVLIHTVFGICEAYSSPWKMHAFWRKEHIYPIYYDLRFLLSMLIYDPCTRCLHHLFSVSPAVLSRFMLGGCVLKSQKGATGRYTNFLNQPFSFSSAELRVDIAKINLLTSEVFRMTTNNEQAQLILINSACETLQTKFQPGSSTNADKDMTLIPATSGTGCSACVSYIQRKCYWVSQEEVMLSSK